MEKHGSDRIMQWYEKLLEAAKDFQQQIFLILKARAIVEWIKSENLTMGALRNLSL